MATSTFVGNYQRREKTTTITRYTTSASTAQGSGVTTGYIGTYNSNYYAIFVRFSGTDTETNTYTLSDLSNYTINKITFRFPGNNSTHTVPSAAMWVGCAKESTTSGIYRYDTSHYLSSGLNIKTYYNSSTDLISLDVTSCGIPSTNFMGIGPRAGSTSSGYMIGSNDASDYELIIDWTPPVSSHTLSIESNPSGYGTVNDGTELNENDTYTIIATPNDGYRFVNWNIAGADSSVSDNTSATTTFTMGTEDAIATAIFDYAYAFHSNINNNKYDGLVYILKDGELKHASSYCLVNGKLIRTK